MTGTSVMKELNVHNSKAGKILRNQLERNNSRQHFRSNEGKFMFRLFVIMLTKIWKYLFSPMLLIKIASTIRDHSFSTCAKFPENLTFLNPWYAPYFSSVYFLEKYGGLSEIDVLYRPEWTKGGTTWKWVLTIFKYKNECYKHGKSRWKKWGHLSSFHVSFLRYGP